MRDRAGKTNGGRLMMTRNKTHALQYDRMEAQSEARRSFEQAREAKRSEPKRPFDSSELRRVPRPRADDPPYRSWWVIDNS